MQKLIIDAKFIPEDQKIWSLHPGRNKRHYEIFKQNSIVFLEIPGFSPAKNTFLDVKRIRRHLRMSKAIYRYTVGAEEKSPNRNPNSYDESIDPADKGFNAAVGNVQSLYHDAKPGDIIIVPGRGHYAPVLIGEIETEFDSENQFSVERFQDEFVPYRKVRWIDTKTEKRKFSKAFSRSTENRHAIIEVDSKSILADSPLKREIYAKVYDTYILDNVSKVSFFGPNYDPSKIRDLIESTQLLDSLIERYQAYRELSTTDVDEFSLDFHSPGKIDIRTLSFGALAVGVAIAGIVGSTSLQEAKEGIEIIFSSSGDQAQNVENDCIGFFSYLIDSVNEKDFEDLRKQCESGEKIGLSTSIESEKTDGET